MPLADDMMLHHENELEYLQDSKTFNTNCKPRNTCVVFFFPDMTDEERAA
jgi:hypothetical protein